MGFVRHNLETIRKSNRVLGRRHQHHSDTDNSGLGANRLEYEEARASHVQQFGSFVSRFGLFWVLLSARFLGARVDSIGKVDKWKGTY
jgi:hypothetical protein